MTLRRLAPLTVLWVAWGVWLVAVVGLTYAGRRLDEARPLAALGAALPAVAVYRLLRRPDERDEHASSPWPWVAAALAMAPALSMFRPQGHYLAPFGPLMFGHVGAVLPFGAVLVIAVRRRTRRAWWRASLAVMLAHGAWASTLGLSLAFLLHWPLFETWRQRGESGFHFAGLFGRVHVGWVEDYCGGAETYAVQVDGTFSASSGAGFHVGPPLCFNYGDHGALVGDWRWYVDD